MWLIIIRLVFLILLVRQIALVLVAWWTGTQSDVPFQSTKVSALRKMLSYLQLKKSDRVYDLGSGTGRVAFFLEKNTSAKLIGVEKNIVLFWISKMKAYLSKSRVELINQDLSAVDISKATAIYTYFSPHAYHKFQHQLETQPKKGTILIAWRYPFESSIYKLKKKILDRHTMYIYRKQR